MSLYRCVVYRLSCIVVSLYRDIAIGWQLCKAWMRGYADAAYNGFLITAIKLGIAFLTQLLTS